MAQRGPKMADSVSKMVPKVRLGSKVASGGCFGVSRCGFGESWYRFRVNFGVFLRCPQASYAVFREVLQYKGRRTGRSPLESGHRALGATVGAVWCGSRPTCKPCKNPSSFNQG